MTRSTRRQPSLPPTAAWELPLASGRLQASQPRPAGVPHLGGAPARPLAQRCHPSSKAWARLAPAQVLVPVRVLAAPTRVAARLKMTRSATRPTLTTTMHTTRMQAATRHLPQHLWHSASLPHWRRVDQARGVAQHHHQPPPPSPRCLSPPVAPCSRHLEAPMSPWAQLRIPTAVSASRHQAVAAAALLPRRALHLAARRPTRLSWSAFGESCVR